ncbi:MAG: class I SAM-dependent methyltransferase [Actinomycetes bacterium]
MTRIRVTGHYFGALAYGAYVRRGGTKTMAGGSRVNRLTDPVVRRMVAARERGATTTFMLGSVAVSDRLAASLWFTMFAHRWARLAQTPAHLVSYRAGLEHLGAPTSVLDVGTGAGASAAAAAERFPNATVVGFDLSRAMLREARRLNRAPNLQFKRGSVLALPFADSSFDVASSLNAVVDPSELRRVLRPDGLMLTASSTFSMRPLTSAWVGRWLDAGFERVDAADTQPGSWEIYRKTG